MKDVIHIGAERGEIEFYEEIGCINLTYAEPDKACLIKLKENAQLKYGATNHFHKTKHFAEKFIMKLVN